MDIYGDTFTVNEQSISKLTAGNIYRGEVTGDLFVLSKNENRSVKFSRPFYLTSLDRVYRAHITTSKKVNRIDVTIKSVIFAKNNEGEFVDHAEAFSITITPKSETSQRTASGAQQPPEGRYRCGHFAIRSKTEQPAINTISIDVLPLDYYQVTICPLKPSQLLGLVRVFAFRDNEFVLGAEPDQSKINGQQIIVRAEVNDISTPELRNLMSLENKAQVSSESGPTIQVTHINEIVFTANARQIAYDGYTIAYTKVIASDRIQNAPTETWDITEGARIPSYLFYGKTVISPNSPLPYAHPVGFDRSWSEGLFRKGDLIRILGRGTRVITLILAKDEYNSVFCEQKIFPIEVRAGSPIIKFVDAADYYWVEEGMPIECPQLPPDTFLIKRLQNNEFLIGSEFNERRVSSGTTTVVALFNKDILQVANLEAVIYRVESSNYFPDIYVDRLINPVDGLGNLVDRDYFIDYDSIVKARKFCVENKFFFDGVVSEGSFEQWATTAAPSSLLFCTEIQGRYALIPQTSSSKNTFLFTDANTIQYSEPGVSWHQNLTNTLLVKYQNNLGQEKQIKIVTQSVIDRQEPEIAQTIGTQGVTSYNQALIVGQVSLKSLRLQTKTCQIVTDLNNGLYCLQGDIIRTQHAQIQHDNERSGIITGVRYFGARYRYLAQTIPITNITNQFLVAAQDINFKVGGSGEVLGEIEISGSPGRDGLYSGQSIARVDTRSLYLTSIPAAPTTSGGTLKIYHYYHDVQVQFSEPISIDGNSRVTICNRLTRIADTDRLITAQPDNWYGITSVAQEPQPGDAFAVGQLGSFIRYWRIVSIQPDIASNKVTINGILWDDDIMTPNGLVTVN